jgi:hypothetical protein
VAASFFYSFTFAESLNGEPSNFNDVSGTASGAAAGRGRLTCDKCHDANT